MADKAAGSKVRVAVFGCLHGMLNEMYRSVDRWEQANRSRIDLIIVCGDCQTIRHMDDLKCLAVPNKYKRIGDFHEYYSGNKEVPRLTIFVGGNHEASNYLMTLPYGGWVCDNFYYLGYAGVVQFKGLRIAGVSGIHNYRNSQRGRFERMPLDQNTLRSVYHTRQLDIFRLQLLSKNAIKDKVIDVFMSHDWPVRIYDFGDREQLIHYKPAFREDIESRDGLGNPMTQPLVDQLRPENWFAAHLHCRFEAMVYHDNSGRRNTRFLSLNKIENRRNFMEVLDLKPMQESESTSDEKDDDLYYDAEWLTILRKTNSLESNLDDVVSCPTIGNESGQSFVPTDEEIKETIDMMNCTGGMAIKHNFAMSEPVIYSRQKASIDQNRTTYYPNPQTEELCSRLKIEDKLKSWSDSGRKSRIAADEVLFEEDIPVKQVAGPE